jgi:DNA helicase-2/ATP-dependent DNA helicase PcrA
MTSLTDVQQRALQAWRDHRTVVVQACPGSGKTRVFVEAIRQEIATCAPGRRGIAALSFTNAAQDEVQMRIGNNLVPPHFLGTLDSFLWRFIVVPFGHLAGVRVEGPVLVAAKIANTLSYPEFRYGEAKDTIPLMQCDLRPNITGSMEVHFKGASAETSKRAARSALAAKQRYWGSSGRLTHSDAQYVAALLLTGEHGAAIRSLLAYRFAAVLVDECQDTRGYMADALVAIANTEEIRMFAVGDPDQSIYGFGGGAKTILHRISSVSGAITCELDETHRCSRRIAKVASALSRRGAHICARPMAADGSALLVVHSHPYLQPTVQDILPVLERAGVWSGGGDRAILARTNSTLNKLRGSASGDCPLSSSIADRAAKAAERFRNGDPRTGFNIMSFALANLFKIEPDASGLHGAGIAREQWRRIIYDLLREAAQDCSPTETWGEWRIRLRTAFEIAAEKLDRGAKLGIYFKKGQDKDEGKPLSFTAKASSRLGQMESFESVHAVKGREFETVLFYVPKPHALHAKCPSEEWWSDTDLDSEEREVAFVAVSRAKANLILAIHEETAAKLRQLHPSFIALFDELRVEPVGNLRTRRKKGA